MARKEYEERIQSPGIFDPEIDDHVLSSYSKFPTNNCPPIAEGPTEEEGEYLYPPTGINNFPFEEDGVPTVPGGWRAPLEPLPAGPDGDWGPEGIAGGPWTPGGPSGPPISSGEPGGSSCEIRSIEPPETVLGYYVPRQIVERHMVWCGRDPQNVDDFNYFNFQVLPRNNRFGIHLISSHIDGYAERQVTRASRDLPPKETIYYEKYLRYLLWSYVLGHEWGHYLAENLSVECRNSCLSVYAGKKADLKMIVARYLPHFDMTTMVGWFKRNDFEEVLAEWAGLRYGVFNFHLPKLKRLPNIGLAEKEVLTRVWLLKKGIVNVISSGIEPYRDVVRWIDINELFSRDTATRFVRGDRNISKTIHNAIKIPGGRKERFTLLDVMENNFLAFTPSNLRTGQIYYCPSNGNGFLNGSGHIPASTRYQLKIRYPQLPQYSVKKKSKSLIKFDMKKMGGESSYCFPMLNFIDTLELPKVIIH
ncbi:MAG: hypothetical protein A4E65_02943 [Syntrophorhabdus sp. PtaU1.Bin153]|nr:MAG: hypothetical protein A4E65_02943 [Syntrophorhabdus sp. PtaU1.Bin153]